MEKMELYEQSRRCPENAQRQIQAGKLKGKTDINPMWRLKKLTELFGPCGTGWKVDNTAFWTTPGAGGEVVAWCSLELRYATESGWSDPLFGIGGSMLVDTQKGNLTTNDDAYKMAYTDAISVACKSLGMAADVYWNQDKTKYDRQQETVKPPPILCQRCGKPIKGYNGKAGKFTAEQIAGNSMKVYHSNLCWDCMRAVKKAQAEQTQAEQIIHENAG